jgi:hypothetical protein
VLIIIGGTGSGKTTTARKLAAQRPIISAGGWVRDLTGIREHSEEAAADLAAASIRQLEIDPLSAVSWINEQVQKHPTRDVVLEGLRNPFDLLHLAKPGDHVLDMGGEGVSAWERSGLAALRGCREWLGLQGVSWSSMPTRHLVQLPEPEPAHVATRFLYGPDDRAGTTEGQILSLEVYPGQPITACWMSKAGGMFHDLPLHAFVMRGSDYSSPDDAVESMRVHPFLQDQNCYSNAPVAAGIPRIESFSTGMLCTLFDRDRNRLGQGAALAVLHWPDSNLLMHLINCRGNLVLWPPHKLMWGKENPGPLPDWKKLRGPKP